ncbi:Sensor histidine kinase RcsC [Alphaproteobacteria bacterium SO-S41]|nr:Sensor histidine kinase RcsC [Alphaproteobacteria bacterium SO-S41]
MQRTVIRAARMGLRMTSPYLQFFKSHPDPMWIFDLVTLQFLDVNHAAVKDYGYSEDEFLGMTIKEIRPPEEVDTLVRHMASRSLDALTEAKTWVHRRKDGSVFHVDVRSHTIEYQGRPARLSTARNIADLISARAESRHIAERLHRDLDNISDGFASIDNDGYFVFANRKAHELIDVTGTGLAGKHVWRDLTPGALGDAAVYEHYLRAIETRQPVSFQAFIPAVAKWLSISAHPSSEGLAVYLQDITAERAQQEHLNLLETAVARLNDIVVISGAVGDDPLERQIIYVNDAFVRRTGYARDEIVGRSSRSLSGPRTDQKEIARIREAIRANQTVRSELLRYSKSGEEYWVDLEITPIADESGNYTRWITVERDITARRKVAEELRLNEERFRTITKATSDVIWDWDLATGVIWRSEGALAVFGYGPDAPLTENGTWRQSVHPEDRQRTLDAIQAVSDGTVDSWTGEYRFQRADGSYANISDRAFVIRDAEGKPMRMVGAMVDVTERRKLEAQLRQSQRLEAVGQLTGGVAHDFNNLLTVILGNSEMLTERLGDRPELQRLADMTEKAAQRGAELTNRLLAFARRQPLDPKTTDVGALVTDMDGLLRRTLGEQFEIEFVRSEGLWGALIDAPQLESALLNLCINARDAMAGGGRMTIETANAHLDEDYAAQHTDVTAGAYVMVAVSDTGSGMDAETIAHAFEPFFTTKDVGKGSGLGLSMVYGFVKQSRGHVKIYSELGHGTTIKLYLPRALAHADQPSAAPRNAGKGGAELILVVEDDDLVRTHVTGLLTSLGYRVTAVEDGQKGLDALKQGDFDLLFTDVVMPGGMGGRQLADAAKILKPDLPVLFTSGYTENAIVHHGRLDAGVNLLQKPYRRQDLADKIRSVLDERTKTQPHEGL